MVILWEISIDWELPAATTISWRGRRRLRFTTSGIVRSRTVGSTRIRWSDVTGVSANEITLRIEGGSQVINLNMLLLDRQEVLQLVAENCPSALRGSAK